MSATQQEISLMEQFKRRIKQSLNEYANTFGVRTYDQISTVSGWKCTAKRKKNVCDILAYIGESKSQSSKIETVKDLYIILDLCIRTELTGWFVDSDLKGLLRSALREFATRPLAGAAYKKWEKSVSYTIEASLERKQNNQIQAVLDDLLIKAVQKNNSSAVQTLGQVAISAIKRQQATIEKQQTEIEKLKKDLFHAESKQDTVETQKSEISITENNKSTFNVSQPLSESSDKTKSTKKKVEDKKTKTTQQSSEKIDEIELS
ncbi:MAG: hypothetical protein COB50_03795 [Thiotrichales bacterium]|nr:MAG: hypothetical protein COB50_03795 [Thiotrichales bacterium]